MKQLPEPEGFETIRSTKAERFNPLKSITPSKLVTQLTAFRAGEVSHLARTMDAIEERDDMTLAARSKAIKGVARMGWDVLVKEGIREDQEEEASRQLEAVKYFFDNLCCRRADDLNEIGGVNALIRQMMDAKGKRYAVHHIQWVTPEVEGGDYTAQMWFTPLWFFENTTGKMRFVEDGRSMSGQEMDDFEWCVGVGDGIGRAGSAAWMYKRIPQGDWLTYCERQIFPIVDAVTSDKPGSQGWNDLKGAISDLGGGDSIVRGKGTDIDTINMNTAGTLPFPELVDRMDRFIAILWLGSDLGTVSRGDGGRGVTLQQDAQAGLADDDAEWLEETMQWHVVRKLIAIRFGSAATPLVEFRMKRANKKDIQARLTVITAAINSGFPISFSTFADEFELPLPESVDGDALMKPANVADIGDITDLRERFNEVFKVVSNEKEPEGEEVVTDDDKLRRAAFEALDIARRDDLMPTLGKWLEDHAKGAAADDLSDTEWMAWVSMNLDKLPALLAEMETAAQAKAGEEAMGASAASAAHQKLTEIKTG